MSLVGVAVDVADDDGGGASVGDDELNEREGGTESPSFKLSAYISLDSLVFSKSFVSQDRRSEGKEARRTHKRPTRTRRRCWVPPSLTRANEEKDSFIFQKTRTLQTCLDTFVCRCLAGLVWYGRVGFKL